MLDIELVRLSDTALLSDDVELTLPDSQTVLVLCDPIWICGMPLSVTHIDRIGRWQRQTGSLVLVDGTFQYAKWNQSDIGELSSRLPADLTFRVVCPTKALAIHGVRFSYMLLPSRLREEIRYPCSNLTGATGTFNDWAAVRMMEQMNSPARNTLLTEYIAYRHDSLLRAGIIVRTRDAVGKLLYIRQIDVLVPGDGDHHGSAFF
jgi:aspartate/methionine/tyrosine aminotransferase